MSIELWAARLERPLTERETEAMLPLLPPERQERLLRIKQSEKRREPLCAYLILRHALWEQYRWRELPPIRLTSLGKPYFPDFPEVHFNLSHTTGAVLVALSGEPVGVDIEHIRPVSERAMRRLADVTTERAFFQSWVRREALARCEITPCLRFWYNSGGEKRRRGTAPPSPGRFIRSSAKAAAPPHPSAPQSSG